MSMALAQDCVVDGEPIHPYKLMRGQQDQARLRDYEDINRARKRVFFGALGVSGAAMYSDFGWALQNVPLNDTEALAAGGVAVGAGVLFVAAWIWYAQKGQYLDTCENWYTREDLRRIEEDRR